MNIVGELKKYPFVVGKTISREQIENYQKKLFDCGLANIPLSYMRLLEETNGICADGISIFGIGTDNEPIEDIYVNNITAGTISQNDIIYLGYSLSEYLCYSWPEKAYLIIDKSDDTILKKFSVFELAIIFFLREYIKKADD